MTERPDIDAVYYCDHEPFRARIEELEAERDHHKAVVEQLVSSLPAVTLPEFDRWTAAEARERKLREALTDLVTVARRCLTNGGTKRWQDRLWEKVDAGQAALATPSTEGGDDV